ncbi:MAG: homoserine O-acetyltransferase [Thermodesulfobacteriota bacterium]
MSEKKLDESPVFEAEMGSVGIVETKSYTFAKPPELFELDNGEKLGPVTVAYETYGELNEAKDNVILIEHALTGSAHVAGRHGHEDKYPGWWDIMVGAGRAFDTDRYYVICTNLLGSCYGSTGPKSVNPETGKPYGLSFPLVGIRDMVRVQKELLDFLGIRRIRSIAGGSMGGMQALEWALIYPEMVESLILIATAPQVTPQSIAIHKVGVQAIMDDPDWNDGNYYGRGVPGKGLAVARMLGHITYLSDGILWEKFGRKHKNLATMKQDLRSQFEVESYLEYQGKKFVDRFDANTYLFLMRSIDIYDAAEGFGSLVESFGRLECRKVFVSSFTADWLYPSYQSKEIVNAMVAKDLDVIYCEIESAYGHDSFLIEHEKLTYFIKNFLNSL